MKKTLILSILSLGILFIVGCGQEQPSQKEATTTETIAQQPETKLGFDKKVLETAAYDAVNARTKGIWDKKIEIDTLHESQKAAKGFWWANDKWDWIAWQKDDGNWMVLVSSDGFNCKELDSVPSEYADFFKDLIYPSLGASSKSYPEGKYCYQQLPQDKEKLVQIDLVNNILNKLPASYIVSEVEYLESFDSEPQKALEAKPCDDKNADPTYSPLCFTKLTILEQEKTDSLEQYIKNNKIMSWYEDALGTKLIKTTYQENIASIYTPTAFMCIGTGGDSCMRKRFVYHLDDGKNILAEISFWPFKNGEYIGNPNSEVQKVIKVYEDLLIK